MKCDKEKTPEEISIDVAENQRKLRLAAEEINFLCELSTEEMDDIFPPNGKETFCKVNKMVNKPVVTVDTVPYCSEMKQLVSNGVFLTRPNQERFEREKFSKDKKYVPLCNRRRFKRTCIKRYESNIRNGFYSGFMTSYLCWNCETILSCHPSPHKRINWIPQAMCNYCKKTNETPGDVDLKWLRELTDAWKGREKENSMYNLDAIVLTDAGRERNAGFEHCWTTTMEQD